MNAPSRVARLLANPERGAGPAVSAAVLVPALIVMLVAVAAQGRIANAGDATEQAARTAARIASIERDPNLAQDAASSAARSALQAEGLACAAVTVDVDVAGLLAPLGEPATVTATVSCQVAVAELAVPGLPGDRTVTATFTSPVDPNRERP